MSGPEPQPGRWLAIVTGAISILIGVLYLALIAVLDSRGPLQPPPPAAMARSTEATWRSFSLLVATLPLPARRQRFPSALRRAVVPRPTSPR